MVQSPLARYHVGESLLTPKMMNATKPPSIKQLRNEEALKIYAGLLGSFIFLVVAGRWLRTAPDERRPELQHPGLRVLHYLLRFVFPIMIQIIAC